MKIVCLNKYVKPITGGEKYNERFLTFLSQYAKEAIDSTPNCEVTYPSWKKILAPILELKLLKRLCGEKLIIMFDASYKYHILLSILLWFFNRRAKTVVIVHHFLFLGDQGFRRIINFCWQYLYMLPCQAMLVPSPYTFDVAKRLFPRKRIFYVPIPFQKQYTSSDDYEKGNWLYVGTIEERKGLHHLIEALHQIKISKPDSQFELNIVGKVLNEDYFDRLKQQIADDGLSEYVKFKGRVSDEELSECYQRAEIFTFPSLLEGYGMVMIEAMSRGVPVIAFANSAMPYTIKDGVNGLLAENENASSFAEKILKLTGNPSLRAELQKGIKETMLHVKTDDDFQQAIIDLYTHI